MDQSQTDSPALPAPVDAPAPALDFAPVPRLKDRSNGWKPEVQQRFIEALAETGSVKAACRRLGRSEVGAYALRRHPGAGSFRAAWDRALDLGIRRIEDHAMDRALYGTEEVVVQNGETIIKRRRYNERLVMFMLRNRAPERFSEGGARGLNAVDKMRLKRLKQAWREEWEAERRQKEPDIEQVRRELMNKVNAVKFAERKRWTEREWRLYGLWQKERLRRRDRERWESYQRNPCYGPPQGAIADEPPKIPDLLGDEELNESGAGQVADGVPRLEE